MAEILSEHFAGVGQNANTTEPKLIDCRVTNSIFLNPATVNEVETIIKRLKNTMTAGDDGIPTKILKSAAAYVSEPLCRLKNSSFS